MCINYSLLKGSSDNALFLEHSRDFISPSNFFLKDKFEFKKKMSEEKYINIKTNIF